MGEYSDSDREHMARALELAERARYTAHPNPMVGCVLVLEGRVVGEGWHVAAGEAHAEIVALEAAGEAARGATAYVTLEPCSHRGRTPPCTDALIAAGVGEVVAATEDPDPRIAGLETLAAAGIRVRSGLLRDAAEALIRGFRRRVTAGRPYVRLKIAASLDGRTAMATGESRWITGADARADVQKLRAASGAVMTGIGTALADDPSLTVRDPALDTRARQPLRAVLDGALRLPPSAAMLALPGDTLVYCVDDRDAGPLVAAGAEIVRVGARGGKVDVAAVLDDLGRREVNDVLVEAGPTLSGALLDGGFVDEIVLYQAPCFLGGETLGMFETPGWRTLADRCELTVADIRRIGTDTRITAHLAH